MRRRSYDGSGTDHVQITEDELLKLKKSGQDSVRGTIIIVRVILSNFVSGDLI